MYHPFSIAETTIAAWNIFRKNFITIIVYSLVSFILLAIIASVIEFIIPSESFWSRMAGSFLLLFVQAYTTLGLYKLIFTVIDSEYYEFEFSQVLPSFRMILSYIVVVFLIAFMITNLQFLLIRLDNYPNIQSTIQGIATIIGLYIALRIMFFITFIVDDHSASLESLKQSFQLTKGYMLKVIVMLLIILALIALPALLAVVYPIISIAIVFTYPFVNIILAVTYRKLVYSHQDIDDDIAETD